MPNIDPVTSLSDSCSEDLIPASSPLPGYAGHSVDTGRKCDPDPCRDDLTNRESKRHRNAETGCLTELRVSRSGIDSFILWQTGETLGSRALLRLRSGVRGHTKRNKLRRRGIVIVWSHLDYMNMDRRQDRHAGFSLLEQGDDPLTVCD